LKKVSKSFVKEYISFSGLYMETNGIFKQTKQFDLNSANYTQCWG